MRTEKKNVSQEKTLLIAAILEHEQKHRYGIYGMKYCQLCGKAQGYSGMYGAMAANSSALFRCSSCKSGHGKHMLDRWFHGSVQACLAARRYVYCQLCGAKVQGTEYCVTRKLRDQGYLCPSCHQDFTERVSRGEPRYSIRSRQDKRLWLESQDLEYLRARVRNQRALALEAKKRLVQLRLVK